MAKIEAEEGDTFEIPKIIKSAICHGILQHFLACRSIPKNA